VFDLTTHEVVKEAAKMAGYLTAIGSLGYGIYRFVSACRAAVEQFTLTWKAYGTDIKAVHDLCKKVDSKLGRLMTLYRAERDLHGEALYEADSDGEVTHVSQGWVRITGIGIEGARGTGWLASVHHQDRDVVRAEWYRCVESGETFSHTFYVASGMRVRAQAKPLYDGDKISGWVALWTRLDPEPDIEDTFPNMLRREP